VGQGKLVSPMAEGGGTSKKKDACIGSDPGKKSKMDCRVNPERKKKGVTL